MFFYPPLAPSRRENRPSVRTESPPGRGRGGVSYVAIVPFLSLFVGFVVRAYEHYISGCYNPIIFMLQKHYERGQVTNWSADNVPALKWTGKCERNLLMNTRTVVTLFILLVWSSAAWSSVDIEHLEAQLDTLAGAERAETLNALAEAYKEESPEETLAYSQEALEVARLHDLPGQEAVALEHIGMAFYASGKYDTALKYAQQALEKQKSLDNTAGVASAFHTIGLIHRDQGDYSQALESCSQALQTYEDLENTEQMAAILETIGKIYIQAEEYEKALSSYKRTLTVAREIGDDALIRETYRYLAEMSFAAGDMKQGREYSTLYDTMLNEQHEAKMKALQNNLEEQFQEEQAEQQQLWKEETRILQKQLQRASLSRRITIWAAVVCVLSLAGVLAFVVYRRRQELRQNRVMLDKANSRSEELLLNAVPAKIARDLQTSGTTIPRRFKNVTVCFCDLFEFTKISATLAPDSLVSELNTIFTALDQIIEGHECERLKTVGDAYLYVCGMPESNSNHAENVIRSAYEILQYLEKRNQYADMKWQIQIGVHTGSVIGGVVGIKKYVYDVFGDTINIASAMKNASEPMRINISETTYEQIQDIFTCTERAPLELKGQKGSMKMYFVENLSAPDIDVTELEEEQEEEAREEEDAEEAPEQTIDFPG